MKLSRSHGERFAAVVTAAALATVALGVSPAHADEDEGPGMLSQLGDITIAQGQGPGTAGKVREFYFGGPTNREFVGTFDLSGVSKLVTVDFPNSCKTAGTIVTCALGKVTQPFGKLSLVFHAKAGVELGAVGTITHTVKATVGGSTSGGTNTLTIGHGPDLVMPPRGADIPAAKPGATVVVPTTFGNHGDVKTVGYDLQFDLNRALNFAALPSNCVDQTDGADSPHWGVCHFTDTLEPNTDYTFGDQVKVKVGADAIGPSKQSMSLFISPAGDLNAPSAKAAPKGVKGTGPALKAVPVKAKPALRKAEIDNWDNYTSTDIPVTDNPSDLAVIGARVAGEAGATVTATVGLRNNGPAFRDFRRSGDDAAELVVRVPEGTDVVTVPADCLGEFGPRDVRSEPGARVYYCGVWSLAPNAQKTFALGLKITKKIADASGDLSFMTDTYWRENENRVPRPDAFDKNKANDVAKLVVNSTVPETLPIPSASLPVPTASPSATPLPVTGVQTGLLAAGGAVVLAAGAGLFLVARRRRVITVAE